MAVLQEKTYENSFSHANSLSEISSDVEETRRIIQRIKIVDFKVKDIFLIPRTVLCYGGELIVRENGLAELVTFGSGRPIILYMVGVLTGPVTTCSIC